MQAVSSEARASRSVRLAVAAALLVLSCRSLWSLGPDVEVDFGPGSLTLGEVVHVATREEVEAHDAVDDLVRLGVRDSEIRDGSVAIARIFCCGGVDEERSATLFYVPGPTPLQRGDIVEIRRSVPGQTPNTLVRIRRSHDGTGEACEWTPPDPNGVMWYRVLYCTGLEDEGWVQVDTPGSSAPWYKPAADLAGATGASR